MHHLLALLPLVTQSGGGPLAPEEFLQLTDTRSEVVNYMPEPSTAMAVNSRFDVWTINPYLDTLLRFDVSTVLAAGASKDPVSPDLTVPTGVAPVALALWSNPAGKEFVLVVCKGTHAMFMHSAQTGEVLDVVPLEAAHELGASFPGRISEGADVVVDPDNAWAFVSCPTTNTVLKIDLLQPAVVDTYHLPVGQRPGPLLFEPGGAGGSDNRVLVAMMVTGNNSTTFAISIGTTIEILDLPQFNLAGLPDEDVFMIDPIADTVTPHVRGAGSLIHDMERNPASSDELWILSLDSDNANPDRNTEPLLRGRFATNQLARVADDLSGGSLVTATQFLDVDDTDPGTGVAYDHSTSVNMARALAISVINGTAFLASPFSSNIVAVLANGDRLPSSWYQLPDNAQCYDVEFLGPNEEALLAYCLGTMTVEIVLRGTAQRFGSLDLGHDPTPDQIRRGRGVFLNGKHSADGRFTCATCHPGGMSDQLAWMIADEPVDRKDAMLTQSLMGIADTFPHHWRGERDLDDFRKAFEGLLGATSANAPTDAEADDFFAFVRSLQGQPNPNENPRRILDDARRSALDSFTETNHATELSMSSPIQGQVNFHTVDNFGGRTCAECHEMPTGSDSNMSLEVFTDIPRTASIEVPHFRQLTGRGTKGFDLRAQLLSLGDPNLSQLLAGASDWRVNLDGFGPTHNGFQNDLSADPNNPLAVGQATIFDFVTKTRVFVDPFNQQFGAANGATELASVWRFVDQFDEGISPSTCWAQHIAPGVSLAELDEIQEVLIDGFEAARGPYNGVVTFGEVFLAGQWWPFRAHLVKNGTGSIFLPDSVSFPQFTYAQLRSAAMAGIVRATVMGTAIGNSERYGIDFDRDRIANTLDLDPFDPDTDNDGFPDGYAGTQDTTPPSLLGPIELDFRTARLAKYHMRFDEDVVFRVEYGVMGSTNPPLEYHSVRGGIQAPGLGDYADEWTFVLTHDHPSGEDPSGAVTFTGTVYVTDRAGNPEVALPLPTFTPMAGGDQDNTEFLLVNSVVPTSLPTGTIPPIGYTAFAFEVTVTEDELQAPGVEGFAPAVGVSVFAIVAKENLNQQPGEPAFEQVSFAGGDLATPIAPGFQVISAPTAANPNPTAQAYTSIPDYVRSPPTNGNGETTIVVFISDSVLGATEDVLLSVQGTLRPSVQPSAPDLFTRKSLSETQMVKREGAMQGVVVR